MQRAVASVSIAIGRTLQVEVRALVVWSPIRTKPSFQVNVRFAGDTSGMCQENPESRSTSCCE